MGDKIEVEVAFVSPQHQFFNAVLVDVGATVSDAIEASGLANEVPELVVDKVGIYGKAVELGQKLKQGDRVEVYRPLVFDPKEARRKRAESKKRKN